MAYTVFLVCLAAFPILTTIQGNVDATYILSCTSVLVVSFVSLGALLGVRLCQVFTIVPVHPQEAREPVEGSKFRFHVQAPAEIKCQTISPALTSSPIAIKEPRHFRDNQLPTPPECRAQAVVQTGDIIALTAGILPKMHTHARICAEARSEV